MGRFLVVGGTRGGGRALALRLSAGGHAVAVIGRGPQRGLPDAVRCIAVDVRDPQGVEKVVRDVVDHGGPLDGLAFFQRFRGEGDDWEGEISTSLDATRRAVDTFALAPNHVEGASIVIVTSVAARLVAREQPLSYHVAKAGLEQLVRYYAVVLGPERIRVNAIAPGTIVKEESRAFYEQEKPLSDLLARVSPLGRLGAAEDVAAAAEFLLSPDAGFITGQTLVVDGGASLLWQASLAQALVETRHRAGTRNAPDVGGR